MTAGSNRQGVRLVTVADDSAGRRLDNFLMSELKGVPRTRIYRLIRKGEVRVNKGRARAAYKLAAGDVVRVPPVTLESAGMPRGISADQAGWISQQIVHEDKELLILDKPSGLAVHGGSGVSRGAIELLRAARPEERYLELVHRLDRDTSGLLLIAKKRSALRRLHEEFREGRVDKLYRALLVGQWQGGERAVDVPLIVEHRENGERFVRPGSEGKPAKTRFLPLEYYPDFVFVEIILETGRTHQIRAHSRAIGHPVAGDRRYGDQAADPEGLKRLFLHAAELGFMHPGTGRPVKYSAPLAPELQALLRALEQKNRMT